MWPRQIWLSGAATSAHVKMTANLASRSSCHITRLDFRFFQTCVTRQRILDVSRCNKPSLAAPEPLEALRADLCPKTFAIECRMLMPSRRGETARGTDLQAMVHCAKQGPFGAVTRKRSEVHAYPGADQRLHKPLHKPGCAWLFRHLSCNWVQQDDNRKASIPCKSGLLPCPLSRIELSSPPPPPLFPCWTPETHMACLLRIP